MFLQPIAMATPPADGAASSGSAFGAFMPLLFMLAIFYFILIRPQRRREKERKEMIGALKTGERVLMTNGIVGEICNVKDKTFIVRIAEKTKIEVVKSAVAQVVEKGEIPEEIQG